MESSTFAAGMVHMAQRGTQKTCGDNGKPSRVLALRGTDGVKRWQVSI